jgi:hypothetical protein
MIQALLDLPAGGLFAALVTLYAATAGFIFWLAFASPARGVVSGLQGVVPPFTASIGVLFALLTGFLANDVGRRNEQAVQAVMSERDALINLNALSLVSSAEMANMRAALKTYLGLVINDEWRRMAEHEESPQTDAAIQALLREAGDRKLAGAASPAVAAAALDAVVRADRARSLRLSLNRDRTNDIKWITVLVLGLLTQIAIGIVHLERPRAHAAAAMLFCLAASVTLSLIALQEYPFDGPLRVSPAPLERALATISKDAAP